jgi:hypothetical protein
MSYKNGQTALIKAANWENEDVCRFLISSSADVTVVDEVTHDISTAHICC